MRLVLMGPPGAGKGTQAVGLAARYSAVHVSTGDLLRANVRDGTELGRTAQAYMTRGEYVPDEITSAMLRERLAQADASSAFVLDGYPRTEAQVGTLDDILDALDARLDRVVELVVDLDELVQRLQRRAIEQGRADDTEPVIRRRQEVYRAETAPLLDLYRARGALVRIDGAGSVDDVGRRIVERLQALER